MSVSFLVAKAWYFLYFSSIIVLPMLNPYFTSTCRLTPRELGLISGLRPWLSAPAAFVWSALADHTGSHRHVLVFTLVISTAVRSFVLLERRFGFLLLIILSTEMLAAPVCVMADSAVVQASARTGTEYGRHRLWGAVGWGSASALAGVLMDRWGIGAVFVINYLLTVPCLACGWYLFDLPGAAAEAAIGFLGNPGDEQHLQSIINEQPVRCKSEVNGPFMPGALGRICGVELVPCATTTGCLLLISNSVSATADNQLPLGSSCDDALGPTTSGLPLTQATSNLVAHGSRDRAVWDAKDLGSVVLPAHEQQPSKDRGSDGQNFAASTLGICVGNQTSRGEHTGNSTHCSSTPAVGAPCAVPGPTSACSKVQRSVCHNSTNGSICCEAAHTSMSDETFWQRLYQLLSRPAVLLFLWTAFVMGTGFGIIDSFLFLHLQRLGGSTTLMGLTLTVTCCSEVVVFQWQAWLLKHLGVNLVLDITIATYALRMLCYAALPWFSSAWAVLPVELLHGITFAAGFGAGTVSSQQLAPSGLEATMQGCFSSCYFGLGYGSGALLGGLVAGTTNLRVMFAAAAIAMIAAGSITLLGRTLLAKWEAQHEGQQASRLAHEKKSTNFIQRVAMTISRKVIRQGTYLPLPSIGPDA